MWKNKSPGLILYLLFFLTPAYLSLDKLWALCPICSFHLLSLSVLKCVCQWRVLSWSQRQNKYLRLVLFVERRLQVVGDTGGCWDRWLHRCQTGICVLGRESQVFKKITFLYQTVYHYIWKIRAVEMVQGMIQTKICQYFICCFYFEEPKFSSYPSGALRIFVWDRDRWACSPPPWRTTGQPTPRYAPTPIKVGAFWPSSTVWM